MSHHAKVWTIGTAGLLAVAMNGSLFAQAPQPRERAGAQDANANATERRAGDANANATERRAGAQDANANATERRAGDANANAASEGPGSQRVISHALYAVMNGSDLHFAAQAVRGGGHHHDAANQANDKDANRENAARQPNENNANDGNRQGRDDASRQQREQVAQQLQQQADRSFQAGDRMLRFAEKGLGADNAAADSRDAWSRRLYTAADQYANSLRSIANVDAGQANRSNDTASRENGNAANRNNENSGQDRDQGRINRVDAARVVLINQAVKESLVAAEMRQAIRAHGSNRPWAQHLQERAQQISNESEQLLKQVQADAAKDGGQNAANPANAAENKDNNQAGQDRANQNANNQANQGRDNNQGRASVQTLAQQALQVVQTLERINSGDAQAAPGAAGARESR